jgi:hypothetical protein|tara:strand:+ start:340 stop:564 length:225 start_codon:yes stop_codon:yes gene_type:complete
MSSKKETVEKPEPNIVTVNDEEINVDTLDSNSILYLNHVFDLDKQINELDFKAQQVRTAKAAFLSMFDKSRKKE